MWGRLNPDGTLAKAVHGRWLQLVAGSGSPHDYAVDHNTALQTGAVLFAEGNQTTGFVFTNNIAPHNADGVAGTGTDPGTDTLDAFFPGWTFRRNVIPGAAAADYPDSTDNFYPATLNDVGFVDLSGGNLRLGPGSPFKGQGTDMTDPGCAIDAVEALAAGVLP